MKIRILLVMMIPLFFSEAGAQVDLPYQVPSAEILELADAPVPPLILTDEAGRQIVLFFRNRYVGIGELMEKEFRLAGLRIDPATNSPSRSALYSSIQVMKVGEKSPRIPAGMPESPRIDNIMWSPDQKKIGFTHKTETGVELWVLDPGAGTCTRLTGPVLNANMGRPYVWFKNSAELLVRMIPGDRKPLIDKSAAIPPGPRISESDGSEAQNPTYQDLLRDKADEFNFTQLVRSELLKVDLRGTIKGWKGADLYGGMDISLDGNYVLVTTIREPYSYLVPVNRFPMMTALYDREGTFIRTVMEKPLLEVLPKGMMATEKGMRNLQWRNDHPATLVWVEALDGGDPSAEAPFRDEVFQWKAPFVGQPESLLKTVNRFNRIIWGNDHLAVASDRWWKNRNTKTYLFNPSAPGRQPVVLFDRNYQDNYGDPGQFLTQRNRLGEQSLLVDGDYLYLTGPGYSESGVRPFIDRFFIPGGTVKRLWQADGLSTLEQVLSVIDISRGLIITSIQSQTAFPNLYIRDILKQQAPQQITFLENPYKSLEKIYKEVITYQRDDGVELSATFYLPAGYDRSSGKKLPMLMWAYPREFKDPATAGQITVSPNQFTAINYGSPLFWVTRGYAILDNAAFPVVGEGNREPNDSFVQQLVSNARAAIDAVDRMGYIDRTRVAVGGHSYGAFMTANLLTHSGLFAAGIARSGAYNRSLTPFGFQSEERNYWEAPEVYHAMSPFMNADKMKTPLLLIHGEADNNSGTFPLQTERYFNALKGLGAPVRMVILPGESHGYASRENILHMLWETDQWLEKWVTNR